MGFADLAKLASEGGLGLTAGVMIVFSFWRMLVGQTRRYDKLLDRVLSEIQHGDGNGAPSLAKVVESQARIEARQSQNDLRLAVIEEQHEHCPTASGHRRSPTQPRRAAQTKDG